MDCPSKFNDTALPSHEDFYCILNDENISDEDYKHAKDVWNTFKVIPLKLFYYQTVFEIWRNEQFMT